MEWRAAEAGAAEAEAADAERPVQSEKQEPHIVMWGKIEIIIMLGRVRS